MAQQASAGVGPPTTAHINTRGGENNTLGGKGSKIRQKSQGQSLLPLLKVPQEEQAEEI